MLPTEVQRVLLLVGLAATAYLLILAWNDDYVQNQQPVEISAEPEIDTPTTDLPGPQAQADSAAIPDPPVSEQAAESDVPDAALLGEARREPAEAPAAVTGERLVKVSTDTLEVWIDRVGGDIVRVQLPQHRLDIDRDVPYLLLNRGDGHLYIAQSGLLGPDGIDGGSQRPVYSAPAGEFTLTGDEPLSVVLSTRVNGLDVSKRFTFEPGSYLVEVVHRVVNGSGADVEARLFAQIKRDDQEALGEKPFSLGPQPYLGAALTTNDSRYEKLTFEDLEEGDFTAAVNGGWIAFLQHYFLSAWIAEPEETNQYYGRKRNDGTYQVGFSSPLQRVAAGAQGEWRARFYGRSQRSEPAGGDCAEPEPHRGLRIPVVAGGAAVQIAGLDRRHGRQTGGWPSFCSRCW